MSDDKPWTFLLDEYASGEVWKAADILCKAGILGSMRLYTGTVLFGPPDVIAKAKAERDEEAREGET